MDFMLHIQASDSKDYPGKTEVEIRVGGGYYGDTVFKAIVSDEAVVPLVTSNIDPALALAIAKAQLEAAEKTEGKNA